MFQAHLPSYFWGDCILTSTYLINRIPSSFLGFLSPYEKLFHKPPVYTHLRVFGCLAHMSVHSPYRLSPRALHTVFIGYPMTQKGYRLYDPVTRQFHISRHVVFTENQFPFAQISSQTSGQPFIIPSPIFHGDDGFSFTPLS